jgi:hypothetical protein
VLVEGGTGMGSTQRVVIAGFGGKT